MKTSDGHVVGPISVWTEWQDGGNYMILDRITWQKNGDQMGEGREHSVIAVYPSLSAAAAANPEM